MTGTWEISFDGGQRIIIAEVFDVLELGGRDRVVLVDDGHDADLGQLGKRVMDVLTLLGVDDILARQQDLRDIDAVFKEHFIVNVHQLALADGGGRLLYGELARSLLQTQLGRADRHCAGRDEYHLEPAVLQVADGAHELLDAADIRLAVVVGQR